MAQQLEALEEQPQEAHHIEKVQQSFSSIDFSFNYFSFLLFLCA